MFYVYVIQSKLNQEVYIGSTNNLKSRLKEHNEGKVFSTKKYKPWTLIYYEAYKSEELARAREKKLKQHGNAKRELKKRIGLSDDRSGLGLPSTTFKGFKSGAGFTVIELLISSVVIIIIFSFVLANFRTGQFSGELDVVTKQIVTGLTTVRTMALAGQLIPNPDPPPPADIFPDGGYGVNFDSTNNPDQFVLFSVFDVASVGNPSYDLASGDELPLGIKKFNNIRISSLCGHDDSALDTLPCESPWQDAGSFLEVHFPGPGETTAYYPLTLTGNIIYVGGVIDQPKTGQQAYFYVSLISGLVTGDLIVE